MPPPSVDDAIRRIAQDRTSGASKLARHALEAIRLALAEARGPPDREDLMEIARRISDAQPAMAIVHNVAYLVARLVAEGHDPAGVLDQVQTELDTAREKIARTYLKIGPDDATIVTLSESENVLETLRIARARGRVRHVYVLESRPLLEGRTLAKSLVEVGLPVTLVADAAGPALLAEATCALVGADSVLRDGAIVNKIGTYALALAAADQKKPMYVAAETLKFDARYDPSSWPRPPPHAPSEILDSPGSVEILNRYFEVIPSRLVTTVVTERGTYAPDVIRTMLARAPGHPMEKS